MVEYTFVSKKHSTIIFKVSNISINDTEIIPINNNKDFKFVFENKVLAKQLYSIFKGHNVPLGNYVSEYIFTTNLTDNQKIEYIDNTVIYSITEISKEFKEV